MGTPTIENFSVELKDPCEITNFSNTAVANMSVYEIANTATS